MPAPGTNSFVRSAIGTEHIGRPLKNVRSPQFSVAACAFIEGPSSRPYLVIPNPAAGSADGGEGSALCFLNLSPGQGPHNAPGRPVLSIERSLVTSMCDLHHA